MFGLSISFNNKTKIYSDDICKLLSDLYEKTLNGKINWSVEKINSNLFREGCYSYKYNNIKLTTDNHVAHLFLIDDKTVNLFNRTDRYSLYKKLQSYLEYNRIKDYESSLLKSVNI